MFSTDPSHIPSLFGKDKKSEEKNLQTIENEALKCHRCALRAGCTQVVFGTGNPKARLMCIGEGPGAQEDEEGKPFVGRGGNLLNRILEAIDLERDDVYISNIVKCRPPGNRKPTAEEMATCMIWVDREMSVVQPEIVVLLGATALQSIINPQGRITKMRGTWIHRAGRYYMPTFHPAALLRDPKKKVPVWKDFQKIQRGLEEGYFD